MSLKTGKPPLSFTDKDAPPVWSELDLMIGVLWDNLTKDKCPGCGRPLSQHLHNPFTGNPEEENDYEVYSVECPASLAIAGGQQSWRNSNKGAIKSFNKGTGKDPSQGIYWFARERHEEISFLEEK